MPDAQTGLGKRTVRDLEVAEGERVLARVDFNVPLEEGRVADDARTRAALPTIELLLGDEARLILCSHLGRPTGRDPATSLRPASDRLRELIEAPVHQAPEVIGPEVRRGAERLEPGSVLVLENTRWERGETENDPDLSKELASLADAYVDDAFGSAHRAHASTVGVAEVLRPAVAGLLLEREVVTLRSIVESPERPLVVLLGGAKVSDKIALIDRFLDTADSLLIGGAMCFSFFRAEGKPTGDSLAEEEGVELARKALEKARSSRCRLLLPLDLVLIDAATGASTMPFTTPAVRLLPHLLVLELSPTGQRAASTAARATSVLNRFSQRGLAMSSLLPSGSRIFRQIWCSSTICTGRSRRW